MSETVGVLGLGRMGSRIAERLSTAGHHVIGFDIDPLVSAAVESAPDAAALFASVDVLVSVLPGRAELAEAESSIVAGLPPGSLWIDLTSGDPRLAEVIAGRCDTRGIDVLFAPMGGGPTAATTGELLLYVSGSPRVIERAGAILSPLGTLENCGTGVGDGLTMKLVANLLWFGQLAAVAEATVLAESLGVSAEALERVLPRTAAASALLDGYLSKVLRGDRIADFGIARVVEELDSLEHLADGLPFDLSRLVGRLHRDALERFGPIDDELLVARLVREGVLRHDN